MKRLIILFLGVFLFAFDILPIENVPYDKNKAKIGKRLFFDKRLSKNKDISCNSCHNIKNFGVDNMPLSLGTGGVLDTPMNTPTVYNTVYNIAWFWNGRAETLSQQVIDALTDPKEHNMSIKEIERIVKKDKWYRNRFLKVYKKEPDISDIADAISEYEKSLILPSRFDKYLKGDKSAITSKERRGYLKFKIFGCITCHNGINIGGNSFQKIGIFMSDIKIKRGLDRYYVTKLESDKYVYKVPSLRNVAKTYPYFHDGSVKTLENAILKMGRLNLGIELGQKDVLDIKAFLESLSGEIK
ncbi:MAG: cytochrome c peroxidase [Nautiliaceae bacterium]